MGKRFSLHLAQAEMSLEKEKNIRKNIEGDYPSNKEIIQWEIPPDMAEYDNSSSVK